MENAPQQMLIVLLDRRIVEENRPIVLGWTWQWFEDKAGEGELIQRAETVHELARLAGINVEILTKTVSKYNNFVENGKDLEFGRGQLQYKIEVPPFYAIKIVVRVVATSGGPATNGHQQVINQHGKLIPGLYAAGEVAGYQGCSNGMFNMGCFIFGQQAGRMAARNCLYRENS